MPVFCLILPNFRLILGNLDTTLNNLAPRHSSTYSYVPTHSSAHSLWVQAKKQLLKRSSGPGAVPTGFWGGLVRGRGLMDQEGRRVFFFEISYKVIYKTRQYKGKNSGQLRYGV